MSHLSTFPLTSVADLRHGLDAGDLSAQFLVQHAWDRVTVLEPKLNALTHRAREASERLALEADRRLAQGDRSPLLGIPVVLKDNLSWTGHPVSNGSRITKGYRAPYDATVVARLLAAGAIPIAKANMDEFAMGSSGEFSAFGPTRNPWDLRRVPGGSSSGSVVSVAAGYVPFALGSDTGGSVRLPASFCGISGFRPTYGVLSRYGVTAMASSLDQVGPVARTASDIALGLAVMAGRDAKDATSVDLQGVERLWNLQAAPLKGLRIGLPRECYAEGLEEGVRSTLTKSLDLLDALGAHLVEVSLPHTRHAIDVYYLINTAEVSSNLSRFDGVRYGTRHSADTLTGMMAGTRDQGFGPEVKRRILLGAFCLSRGYYDAFYLKAQKARTLLAQDFDRAFQEVDVLLTPAAATTAFPLGDKLDDPMAMYLTDLYTVPQALAALPAVVVPAGLSDGLPVGLQWIGRRGGDVALLEVAHAFQSVTEFHRQAPHL